MVAIVVILLLTKHFVQIVYVLLEMMDKKSIINWLEMVTAMMKLMALTTIMMAGTVVWMSKPFFVVIAHAIFQKLVNMDLWLHLEMASVTMKLIMLNVAMTKVTVVWLMLIQIIALNVHALSLVSSHHLDFHKDTTITLTWHGLFNSLLDNI